MEQFPIVITPKAREYLEGLKANRKEDALFVHIFLERRGCAGFSYSLEYRQEAAAGTELLDLGEGIAFCLPRDSVFFLAGTEVDYNPLRNELTLKNPNEKGRCGCGASFRIG